MAPPFLGRGRHGQGIVPSADSDTSTKPQGGAEQSEHGLARRCVSKGCFSAAPTALTTSIAMGRGHARRCLTELRAPGASQWAAIMKPALRRSDADGQLTMDCGADSLVSKTVKLGGDERQFAAALLLPQRT